MELVPPFVPPLVDHTRYLRHAPARLRVDANMFILARGYVAVCLLRALWFAQGAKRAKCGATSVVGPKTYAQSLAELTNIQVCQPAR